MSDSDRSPYDDETKRLAYQLWLYECGRDAGKVSQIIGVNVRTIYRWVAAESWHDRADADLKAIMPDLVAQSAVNLRLVGFHVSRRLLAIARDADHDHLAPNAKEVDALVKMLDRGGFSPVGMNRLPDGSDRDGGTPLANGSIEAIIAAHHAALAVAGGEE